MTIGQNSLLPALPTSWKWVEFSTVCERVSVGHVGPTTKHFVNDITVGIPLIRSQNVRPGKLDLSDVVYISFEFHEKLKKSQLKDEDVLIVRVGANRGDCCLVPKGTFKLNCANIVFARPYRNSPFFCYYFQSNFGRKSLLGETTGAAQEVINTKSIAKIKVPYPPLQTQRRIASILSAYDHLIENNRRRIALLEQAARELYREWFVRLRFPGYEKVKVRDGVPEGWERVAIGDVSSFISRGITPQYDEEAIGIVINQKCIRDQRVSLNLSRRQKKKVPQEKHVQFGDVLVNSTGKGTLGRVGQVLFSMENCTVDSHVTIVRPQNTVPMFLYGQTIMQAENYLESMGRGATNQTELSKDVIAELPFLLPPESISERYEQLVSKRSTEINNLERQISLLVEARDILLPRLMSGEIEV